MRQVPSGTLLALRPPSDVAQRQCGRWRAPARHAATQGSARLRLGQPLAPVNALLHQKGADVCCCDALVVGVQGVCLEEQLCAVLAIVPAKLQAVSPR